MAEKSLFWTTGSVGDGTNPYTQSEIVSFWERMFSGSANQGVVYEHLNELAVSGAASPVSVATGSAVVAGFPYLSDEVETVAVTTPSIDTTGHRVVLRADYTAQTVRITLLSSSDGVASFPALTQNPGTTYDVPLAGLTITTGGVITITDEREYATFATPHVKKSGDTMAGNLTLESSGPRHILTATTAPVNETTWDITALATGDLLLRVINDAGDSATNWLRVTRSGTAINTISLFGDDLVLDMDDSITLDAGSGSVTVNTGNDVVINTADDVDINASGDVFISGLSLLFNTYPVVPLRARKGGSGGSWAAPGTSVFTPSTPRIQVGSHSQAVNNATGSFTITFPAAFGNTPLVFVMLHGTNGNYYGTILHVASPTTTNVAVRYAQQQGLILPSVDVFWLAIGDA